MKQCAHKPLVSERNVTNESVKNMFGSKNPCFKKGCFRVKINTDVDERTPKLKPILINFFPKCG